MTAVWLLVWTLLLKDTSSLRFFTFWRCIFTGGREVGEESFFLPWSLIRNKDRETPTLTIGRDPKFSCVIHCLGQYCKMGYLSSDSLKLRFCTGVHLKRSLKTAQILGEKKWYFWWFWKPKSDFYTQKIWEKIFKLSHFFLIIFHSVTSSAC